MTDTCHVDYYEGGVIGVLSSPYGTPRGSATSYRSSMAGSRTLDVLAGQGTQFRASGTTELPGFQTTAVFRRARDRRNSGPATGGNVTI